MLDIGVHATMGTLMRLRPPRNLTDLKAKCALALAGPQMLAFVPAVCLAGFWIGGETVLVAVALGVPLLWAMLGGLDAMVQRRVARTTMSGLVPPDTFVQKTHAIREDATATQMASAIFAVELDDYAGHCQVILTCPTAA